MTRPSSRTVFEMGRFPYRWMMSRPSLVPLAVATVRRHQVQRLVTRDTGVLIDGHPRSANTFAVHAFRSVNPEVSIAHHLHCPGHLLRGVRFGVPVLLVVREPADSVVSEVVRDPRRTLSGALSDWIHFHRRLVGHLDEMVVSTFDETTGDFGTVIERLNTMFGTSFRPYVHSPDNDSSVMASIQRVTDAAWSADEERSRRVPRPTAERSRLQDVLMSDLVSASFAGPMETAVGYYEAIASQRRRGA